MTSSQSAAAHQLAAALGDALPVGTFDEAAFVVRVLSGVDATPDGETP